MSSRLKFSIIIGILIIASIYIGDFVRNAVISNTNGVADFSYNLISNIKNKFKKHFLQAQEIADLRAQNVKLEESNALLSTFSYQLNNLLNDKNSALYTPKVKLIKALSYANIGDYDKIWVEFDEFKEDKIYGLIFDGKTAGIIINKDGKPLALLQTDPDAVFSVYIGNDKIVGIARGNNSNLIVNYISNWLSPKIGDAVYTTGLDDIFFGGIPVGKVVGVKEDDLYKSAIVEPDNRLEVPSYLYVVLKDS